jgi:hypothetical protein
VDPLLFSSLWAACVAASLVLAASLAMELPPSMAVIGLAASGTLVVYNVDRLRDLERDRKTSPLRSAFVERNRPILSGLVGAAALLSLLLALGMGPRVWLLCAAGLAVGLLHRRLKGVLALKTLYVSAVWVGVVVGLPALAPSGESEAGRALHVGWVLASLGCALGANLIASNHGKPGEGIEDAPPAAPARPHLALVLSIVGAGIATLGPSVVRPLAWVGIAEALSIWAYRCDERYGLLVLDGALLAGAIFSISLTGL